MAVKVSINGFGRIEKNVLRTSRENNVIEIVAITDLSDEIRHQTHPTSKTSPLPAQALKGVFRANSFFYLFSAVMLFSFISLVVCVYLSIYCKLPSQMQQNLFEACLSTWKLCIGALLGLLAGKAMGSTSKKYGYGPEQ